MIGGGYTTFREYIRNYDRHINTSDKKSNSRFRWMIDNSGEPYQVLANEGKK